MIEGHTFIDGYFINGDYDIVETIWFEPNEEVYRTHVVLAEDGDSEWEKLKEIVSVDDLMERTYIRFDELKEQLDEAIVAVASEGSDWESVKTELGKGSAEAFLEVLMFDKGDNEETNKEKLFIFKLALFDWEPIKTSKDKELKKKLRKAKSIIEAVHIVTGHLM